MLRLPVLVLVFGLAACSHRLQPLSGPRPDTDLAELQPCDDDSECVRVDNGCCDCANGGASTAINRKYEKEFRDSFDCRRTICSQKAGNCLSQIVSGYFLCRTCVNRGAYGSAKVGNV
jgi:hypothetical protein